MGAAIDTPGTTILKNHFNAQFRPSNIQTYRNMKDMFNRKGADISLLDLTNAIPSLLPAPDVHNPNLNARWLWFLNVTKVSKGALTQANHNAIADCIFDALDHASVYASIHFQVTEDPSAAQHVSCSANANEMDLLLTVTGPMPRGTSGSIDPPPIS